MSTREKISALCLTQWLDIWNEYDFDPGALRRKPKPKIYLFTMSANRLRQLSDVYRRERDVTVAEGIQRVREENRTLRIKRYVKFGYPYGDIKKNLRKANSHLRKPGWLPTAIVVNMLTEGDQRRGKTIKRRHIIGLKEENGSCQLSLPAHDDFDEDDLRSFEVIDGQHRLWAFDDEDSLAGFELPVVAFHGLDVAWQAYLFWSINISPVRINPSHAFDLYPLLRTQDWLETTGELTVYREARAQEITEWLFRYDESPWHNRISMLQRKGEPRVSQAAWVRSLIGSFFSTGRGKGRRGLFQCTFDDEVPLEWERAQQIAFVLAYWCLLRDAVAASEVQWKLKYQDSELDAFTDRSSMLNQDMGVRAVHAVVNDVFYHQTIEWRLHEWEFQSEDKTETTALDIKHAIESLTTSHLYTHLNSVAQAMSSFDWRSLDGPDVRNSGDEMTKRAFRGSGGYTLLITSVLTHVSMLRGSDIAAIAEELSEPDVY